MHKLTSLFTALLVAMAGAAPSTDLSGVKTYLLGRLASQKAGTAQLRAAADRYYALASKVKFDYAALARTQATPVRAALQDARAGWGKASPLYEEVEGIVAGVDALSTFDLILDAGVSGAEGSEGVAPIDLKLPGGGVLRKPGNLFGVNEASLWGLNPAFTAKTRFDVAGDGTVGFGDVLPDARVLQAAAAELDRQTGLLIAAAGTWQPSQANVFGALIANVPTVGPVFFDGWKTSRFVLGGASKRGDFAAISRLNDLVGNVRSWEAMFAGLSPALKTKDAALEAQIRSGLADLRGYAQRLSAQERQRRFTPEQAEGLQTEGQNRATAITGQLTQAAALLGVKVGQ